VEKEMPDVWTNNPSKLFRMLTDTGWKCPGEARIIRNRDPDSTCNITKESWYGDIYVHDAVNLAHHPYIYGSGALMFVIGAMFGYVAAKRGLIKTG
jgi:hypothetical protein